MVNRIDEALEFFGAETFRSDQKNTAALHNSRCRKVLLGHRTFSERVRTTSGYLRRLRARAISGTGIASLMMVFLVLSLSPPTASAQTRHPVTNPNCFGCAGSDPNNPVAPNGQAGWPGGHPNSPYGNDGGPGGDGVGAGTGGNGAKGLGTGNGGDGGQALGVSGSGGKGGDSGDDGGTGGDGGYSYNGDGGGGGKGVFGGGLGSIGHISWVLA